MQEISFNRFETTVVHLIGQITTTNAGTIQQQLLEAISAQECSSLLVDMSQVEALDSAGLMALVSTLTAAQQLDKQFSLFGVSPSVKIVLELTQLDRVFEIREASSELEIAA